jgi:hypothetical protein
MGRCLAAIGFLLLRKVEGNLVRKDHAWDSFKARLSALR